MRGTALFEHLPPSLRSYLSPRLWEEAVGTLLAAAASAAMARPAVALTGGGTELHGPRIHLRVDEGTRCGVAWRRGTELHGPRIHCG